MSIKCLTIVVFNVQQAQTSTPVSPPFMSSLLVNSIRERVLMTETDPNDQIIFMLNLRAPPCPPLAAGPSTFLKEYSTEKLFLCCPLPRLHTNSRMKQKRTTPRNMIQPIAVDMRMVLRSRVNFKKTLVSFRFVSLRSPA